MKVLGITGGVGAGKSTVLDYMQNQYHARVIKCDQVGHMVQEPGQSGYQRIVETFGADILDEEKRISREKLSAAVFGDRTALEKLNQIVHPSVKEYVINEIESERTRGVIPFVVVEAALLLEDHYDLICDDIWYIYADEAVRQERLMRTRGYSEDKVRKIMNNQMKEEEFRKNCSVVIDNSGCNVETTYIQIEQALKEQQYI